MANMFFIVESNVHLYIFFCVHFIYSICYNNEIDARKGLKGQDPWFRFVDLRAQCSRHTIFFFYYHILYRSLKRTNTKAILFRFHFYDSPDILMWIAAYFFLWILRILVCIFFLSPLCCLWWKRKLIPCILWGAFECVMAIDVCLNRRQVDKIDKKKRMKNIQLHESSRIEFSIPINSSILLESDTFTFWCQIPYILFVCVRWLKSNLVQGTTHILSIEYESNFYITKTKRNYPLKWYKSHLKQDNRISIFIPCSIKPKWNVWCQIKIAPS